MLFRLLTSALMVTVFTAPTIAYAGPDEDVRDTAKADLAEARSEGWPQSRCSLSAYITNGGFIYGSYGSLRDGDKLLYLGDQNVEGQSTEAIVAALKGIGSDVRLPVRVERDGEVLDATVQCEDAGKMQAIDLAAMEFASRKKFPECVAEAQKVADRSQTSALWAYRCALVKNPEKYDISAFTDRVLTPRIIAANYDPALRADVLKAIRQNRGALSEPYYRRAVERTKSWPGGESLFEASEPDWLTFRQNAERAVLTGFFDPGSAVFEWPKGFTYGFWKPVLQGRIEGWWTCGRINAKNRMGGYVGSRYFVVVMNDDGNAVFTETGTGGDYDFVSMQCANSVAYLPPAPREFFEVATINPPIANPASVADELKKLKDLFDAGALSEDEYKAAKAKILGS